MGSRSLVAESVRPVDLSHEPDPSVVTAEPGAGATAAGSEATPAEYRTFSRKLAPALTGMGGAAAAVGGLGTWVRATELETVGADAVQVATVVGFQQGTGWLVAVLGLVAAFASRLWAQRDWRLVAVPLAASLVAAGTVVWQVVEIGGRVRAMADAAAAREELDFVVHHAVLGWGAWLMVTAAVLLALGALLGLLRAVDVRGGISDAN